MKETSEIGLIILAAGASTRFGAPKQLQKFQGETLLRRIARESLLTKCRPVVVVLGAEIEKCSAELKDFQVYTAENPDWESAGMGSSVKTGLEKVLEIKNSIDAVVLTVCDQPFVTEKIINELIETRRKTAGASIVASRYGETLGVPALFAKKFFPQLKQLNEAGAKKIIRRYESEAASIAFPAGAIDIDTPEDLAKLES